MPRLPSHALGATAGLCRLVLAAAALAEAQVAELGAAYYPSRFGFLSIQAALESGLSALRSKRRAPRDTVPTTDRCRGSARPGRLRRDVTCLACVYRVCPQHLRQSPPRRTPVGGCTASALLPSICYGLVRVLTRMRVRRPARGPGSLSSGLPALVRPGAWSALRGPG